MLWFDSHPPDARFVIEPFSPAYTRLSEADLVQRARDAVAQLDSCSVCPRRCGVNRLRDEEGFCGTGRRARISSVFPHHGEENCLRGMRGSGTLFLGGCNLACVFCLNAEISQGREGELCSAETIGEYMIHLQDMGCHNINFVTPEHAVPQVIEALAEAITRGLRLPVVYNTSAYDSMESLRLLDGLVDIYMPDFKFWDPDTAARLSDAEDYPERAREAIVEMHRQVGVLRFGREGLARRGVLVRHLVMPGQAEQSASILRWLAEELSPDTFVNIMEQYRPCHRVGTPDGTGCRQFGEIDRRPTPDEFEAVYGAARQAGLWRFDT